MRRVTYRISSLAVPFSAATALAVLLLLGTSGCHAIGDPSCAVHEELADQHGLRALYAPGLSLNHIDENCWHHCPPAWCPACPPLLRCPRPLRRIPSADEVLAVPAVADPARRDPDPSTLRD
ncbi:hypothetical protein Mal4_18700 [Maioricimonas rarisocia]|uniref:Secreted protein n=1 Tax=Maioricimonas rarisocia TaxID=2528026 RepID=A0A517Z502_9PLAN|nr:hypothetical protein [Maioricimonas rarisocia]QDU37556.1 hypothetical protein Mal4_18700 [Maioricimonas rarisocia]